MDVVYGEHFHGLETVESKRVLAAINGLKNESIVWNGSFVGRVVWIREADMEKAELIRKYGIRAMPMLFRAMDNDDQFAIVHFLLKHMLDDPPKCGGSEWGKCNPEFLEGGNVKFDLNGKNDIIQAWRRWLRKWEPSKGELDRGHGSLTLMKTLSIVLLKGCDFQDISLKELVNILINSSRKADVDKKGVRLELSDGVDEDHRISHVTFATGNVLSFIKHLAVEFRVDYQFKEDVVVIVRREPVNIRELFGGELERYVGKGVANSAERKAPP
ncbi:MAG: hypothetical protein HY360_12575 [Verrucomicrobia bacterium]|nr:hypothetical protein [Verrucomicrobiota bacterium]